MTRTALLSLLFATSAAAQDRELAKFHPDDATNLGGMSLAVSGTTAIVGAPFDSELGSNAGAAYLFDTSTGAQIAKLLAADGSPFDEFGTSVDVDGDVAVVGAKMHGVGGAAYLFDVATGQQLFKLVADDIEAIDLFGYDVAISGAAAIVGSPWDGPTNAGSVYVFDVATGQQLDRLTPFPPESGSNFGWQLALDGSTALIGAPQRDGVTTNTGGAFLFDVASGQQLHTLLAGDGAFSDCFGCRVALDGNTALVAAINSDNPVSEAGAVYVFDATTGQETNKLTRADAQDSDTFGTGLALEGGTAAIGAYRNELGDDAGGVYLYDTSTWQEYAALFASDGGVGDRFGVNGLGLSNNTLIVPAAGNQHPGQQTNGSLYTFLAGPARGAGYCGLAAPNSSGAAARLGAFGWSDPTFGAVALPTGQFALLLNSLAQGSSVPPGSQGTLCLGGAIGRHTQSVRFSGDSGSVWLDVDLTDLPTPSGPVAVQPGETWNFQVWFRDANPGPTSNFTDAVSVTFR